MIELSTFRFILICVVWFLCGLLNGWIWNRKEKLKSEDEK